MTLFIPTAQTCPLCQQANGCALEQGLDIGACWCAKQMPLMTPVIALYVAEYPLLSLADNQCICQSCMTKLVLQFSGNPVETYTP